MWRAVNRQSCTSQPVNSSWPVAPNRRRLGDPRVARRTNPASAHNPCSTEGGPRKPSVTADKQPAQRVGLGCRQGRHINLGSAHIPPGTAKRRTNNPHDKECEQWDETSAHKPHNVEDRRGELEQVHTSPVMQRPARGAESRAHISATQSTWPGSETTAHQPRDTEGGPQELSQMHTSPTTQRVSGGGWGRPAQVAGIQKDPHILLPSKFQPKA